MAITVETIERAPEQTIKELMEFPTTILSDSMEKCQTMHAEIKPSLFNLDSCLAAHDRFSAADEA